MQFYKQTWIKKFGIVGLTIWPFIFYAYEENEVSPWLKYHEEYHYKMQIRWLLIPRFIAYWYLYVIHGYWNHPYEVAARDYADKKVRV